MINFRYNIRERLGAGGSGEVYVAEDTCRKNQRVAIKIHHAAEREGEATHEAFQNEVSSLMSLSHPNLIKIFDYGIIRHADAESLRHRRFFTMELLAGIDALKWTSPLTGTEHFESMLELLFLQSLSVLSYIHQEGIIHFDIKPDNLVVFGDRSSSSVPILKLMDFGFSKKNDESNDVSTRGTLHYTAPELLLGERPDHRVDLYSVGAAFYHLLEGHPPFEANNPVDLAKRILAGEATLSNVKSNKCERLHRVIDALMQKDLARRCKSAEEAARILVAGLPKGEELFESYFGFSRSPKFVGRRNELAGLRAALSSLATKSSPPQVVAFVLSGIEGIGKTTLLHESLRYARSLDLSVYELEAQQSDVPFEGIANLLRLIIADIQSVSNLGRSAVKRFIELIEFVGDESTLFERWGHKQESTVELMARFILECSEEYRFVLSVDNVQFLDDATRSVLKTVTRDAASGKLLVILAETAERATVLSGAIVREVPLEELGEDEVSQMCVSMLGDGRFTGEIGAHLYSLYGGIPGVVVEALNAARELMPEGGIAGEAAASEYINNLESKLPRTLDDFLIARFNKLGKERQLILNLLACFQFPVRAALVEQLLPFHARRMADHIRFLQLDGFVSAAGNGLSIRMKRLKDSIYDLIKAERPELHTLIASLLERDIEGSSEFTRLQELGHQFSQSGAYEKAAVYYEKAADEGLRLFALQRAMQLYREALNSARQSGGDESERRLNVKYTSALLKAGSYSEAIQFGGELNENKNLTLLEQMTVLKVMGLSSSRLGENDHAREFLDEALQLASDSVERLELRQELVALLIAAGDFVAAEKQCHEQLAQAAALGIDRLVGVIYTDLGIALFFQDRFDNAVECFSEALKRYKAVNERTQVVNSMNNIGNALSAKGDFNKAIEFWIRALRESQEFGTLNQQAQIYNNLGIAHYNLKKYDKAKEFNAEARSRYDRIGSMVGLATVLMNLGEVLLAEGEYEAALQRFVEGYELFATMENSYFQVQSSLHAVQAHVMLGDTDAALLRLEEVEKLIVEKKQESFLSRHRYLHGLARLKCKELDVASRSFQEAIKLAQKEKASEILWLSQIRLAECMMKLGRKEDAMEVAHAVLTDNEASSQRQIVAEVDYLLGTMASGDPLHGLSRPIVYFKHGIDTLAKEPVTEMTWKLAFALAREYYERGQRERAKEYLAKTRLILQFFLSHFKSDELKRSYLAVDEKDSVMATIDRITRPK